MEALIQLLFEFLLQLLIEGGLDLLVGRITADRPFIRFFLCLFAGAVLGGLSLLFLPEHVITLPALRYAAVFFVPLLIGFVMSRLGSIRRKHGRTPFSLEYFASSWAFAFAFGLVRVALAK